MAPTVRKKQPFCADPKAPFRRRDGACYVLRAAPKKQDVAELRLYGGVQAIPIYRLAADLLQETF
jgi:hypothetical protein